MKNLIQLNSNAYLYIWKFRVALGKETEFQKNYGPDGNWVQLFRQGAGYQQTLLLKDLEESGNYTTVDIWESEAAYNAFKNEFAEAFEALDKHCESLTVSEERIGSFINL